MLRLNIYQMYQANSYKLGFYVRKLDWPPGQKAQVLDIEGVIEGHPIEGPPPYFTDGLVYPKGHKKEEQQMGPRQVTLRAPWAKDGKQKVNGGTFNWEQVEETKYLVSQNIYEMYTDNNFKFGFWVTRPKWNKESRAQVVGIEGVTEGDPIPGIPPYYNKEIPGIIPGAPETNRSITLKSDKWEEGIKTYSNGGTYSWERVE
jgi:hypothetical protein